MKRRDFIKMVGTSTLIFPMASSRAIQQAAIQNWNSYRLTYQVNLPTTGKKARLWLPLPDTNDTVFQFTQGSVWSGSATKAEFTTIGKGSFPVFLAEWLDNSPRQVTVSSIVKTSDHSVNLLDYYSATKTTIPANIQHFIRPTQQIPLDGIVRETAISIVKKANAQTPLQQAQAIYDWIIENARHNDSVRGRGKGDVKSMLLNNKLNGKCADLNGLFVGLARAMGIPARYQYGIRVKESKLHEKLGRFGDISESQHCRAEFYLGKLGWIPVDPADVCKVIQRENLPHNHPIIVNLKDKLFGSWEMNWITFNHGEDISLPRNSASGKLPFFMYPHAEIDNQIKDSLNPADFTYKILSSELIGTGAKF